MRATPSWSIVQTLLDLGGVHAAQTGQLDLAEAASTLGIETRLACSNCTPRIVR